MRRVYTYRIMSTVWPTIRRNDLPTNRRNRKIQGIVIYTIECQHSYPKFTFGLEYALCSLKLFKNANEKPKPYWEYSGEMLFSYICVGHWYLRRNKDKTKFKTAVFGSQHRKKNFFHFVYEFLIDSWIISCSICFCSIGKHKLLLWIL